MQAVHGVEVGRVGGARRGELVEHPEHLEQRRALAPRAGLGDRVALPLRRDRVLPRGLEGGQVRPGEDAGKHRPAGVPVGPPGEVVDGLRHEPLRPGPAHGVDALLPGAARRPLLADQPFQGVGPGLVGQQRARHGRGPVDQPGVGRGRPVLLEELLHRGDRRADPLEHGVAVARVVQGGRGHLGQGHRAPVAQQDQPGLRGPGDRRGQRTGAGDPVEAGGGEVLGGGACRGRALPAEHAGHRVVGGGHDQRQVTPGAVEVRLDDLQHQAGGDRAVGGVAVQLEHPHGGLRGQPVGARDHPVGPGEGGPRGEGRHQARVASTGASSSAARARRTTRRRARAFIRSPSRAGVRSAHHAPAPAGGASWPAAASAGCRDA